MMASHNSDNKLTVISYNLHGFNQGSVGMNELITRHNVDVLMIQEHWLTPDNLYKLSKFDDYCFFGMSAMSNAVSNGILYGRPYGGVATLIKKSLRVYTRVLHCDERYVVIKIDNYIVSNVYLPCAGTNDRTVLYGTILDELSIYFNDYKNCNYIFGGDLNVDLDLNDANTNLLQAFFNRHSLMRCDLLFPQSKGDTYVNEKLNQSSAIDYILTSSPERVGDFIIVDLDINYSDHLPIKGYFSWDPQNNALSDAKIPVINPPVEQLRWDKGDINSYYSFTRQHLEHIWSRVKDFDKVLFQNNFVSRPAVECQIFIDETYRSITEILTEGSKLYIPKHSKNFYKFWWDRDLDVLKQASIETNNAWKAAGKPRYGDTYQKRNKARNEYRKKTQRMPTK